MEQAFSGQRVSFESQIAYREGGIRYVQADYVPHINHEGKVEGYFSLVSDISDRKQIEQERERFLSVGSDLLVITGINGYFQWVSPTFERTLGWTVDEMISRPWTDFVHPDDINASILETDLFSGNETTAFENRYRHKDGSYRWFLWNARPYPKEQVIYGAAVDITERKQAEVTLQVRSAELQHVTETVGVGLARCSRDLRYLSANPAYAQLVETTLEEIVGKLMVDVLGEAALERIRPYCDRVLRGERVEYEPEMVFATGKVRYLHVVYTPDKDSEGNIYRLDRFNHGHHQSQTSRSRTGATLSRPHG
jgi:PAS domain S-box-containing protein